MNSLELLFTSITFLDSTQKNIINSHNFAWIGVTFPTAARKLTDYQNIDWHLKSYDHKNGPFV